MHCSEFENSTQSIMDMQIHNCKFTPRDSDGIRMGFGATKRSIQEESVADYFSFVRGDCLRFACCLEWDFPTSIQMSNSTQAL